MRCLVLTLEKRDHRQLTAQLAAAQELAQQANVLANQVANTDKQVVALQEQVAVSTANAGTLSARVRELELTLAISQATLASQQEIAAELRAHLATRKQTGERLSTGLTSGSFP